jgi:phospholipid/cholesterol/gamma-HCH transport system substrate-binding protein
MNVILDENKTQKGVVTNLTKFQRDFAQISDSIKKANLGKTVKELNATIAK